MDQLAAPSPATSSNALLQSASKLDVCPYQRFWALPDAQGMRMMTCSGDAFRERRTDGCVTIGALHGTFIRCMTTSTGCTDRLLCAWVVDQHLVTHSLRHGWMNHRPTSGMTRLSTTRTIHAAIGLTAGQTVLSGSAYDSSTRKRPQCSPLEA